MKPESSRTSFYFLRKDFEALEKRIFWLQEQIRSCHSEMGGSCEQSSETWHDNFGYEEGSRGTFMWSTELRRLLQIRNHATMVESGAQTEKVVLGSIITLEDEETGEEKTVRIGSFLTFKKGENGIPTISYAAPLVAPFLGASRDDSREVELPDGKRSFILVDIQEGE